MILTIDIGNTNIIFGVVESIDKIIFIERVATDYKKTNLEYIFLLKQLFDIHKFQYKKIRNTIISSVVPEITNRINDAVVKLLEKEPILLSVNDSKFKINIDYDNKVEIGMDRLVNAEAAYKLYGAPAIIIDTGTAITICYLSEEGFYKGGLIMPGFEISALSLHNHTAKLPLVSYGKPESIVGRNTVEGIRSGLYYGVLGSLKYIVEKIKMREKGKIKVVLTGGNLELLKADCDFVDFFDKDLTVKGLFLLSEIN